jgi:hypothetical protein
MNELQAEQIAEQLEMLSSYHQELRRRLDLKDSSEELFVKALEKVQGDERDVVFVSVGYGRDAAGGFAMNFGPVSAAGGERRLNVLMTRAKRRCEIFSSIRAEDIDPERASGAGPAALKEFLAAAAAGTGDAGGPSLASRGDERTPIAPSIVRFLESRGLRAARDVGIAGLFVDVAVEDVPLDGVVALAPHVVEDALDLGRHRLAVGRILNLRHLPQGCRNGYVQDAHNSCERHWALRDCNRRLQWRWFRRLRCLRGGLV